MKKCDQREILFIRMVLCIFASKTNGMLLNIVGV